MIIKGVLQIVLVNCDRGGSMVIYICIFILSYIILCYLILSCIILHYPKRFFIVFVYPLGKQRARCRKQTHPGEACDSSSLPPQASLGQRPKKCTPPGEARDNSNPPPQAGYPPWYYYGMQSNIEQQNVIYPHPYMYTCKNSILAWARPEAG